MPKISSTRADQAEETKQKLLDNALVLFSEQGYNKTSVRALARQAGLSDGILYHHFPEGKQQILSVLLNRGIQHALVQLSQFNQDLENVPLDQVLNTLCELCVVMFSKNKDLLKVILRESENMQLNEIHVVSHLFQIRQQWLAQLLAQRAVNSEIRVMDYASAAQQFMAVNIQYGLTYLLNLNIGCDIANIDERKKMIQHTLMLWQPTAI